MRHADGEARATVLTALVLMVTGALALAPARVAVAAGESAFVGLTPCRLVDTRGNGFADPFGPPALATAVPRDFPLQGQCGIPATATAVSLNVTATNTQGPGFLLLYPQGGAQPLVSTLNYVAGETVANAAIVPLGAGGLTVVAGVSGTDLILDVDGYFTDVLVHATDLENLFVGPGAGNLATTGHQNTAVGTRALNVNGAGNANTAIGREALFHNDGGGNNTAVGVNALHNSLSGGGNTATGLQALATNVTGSSNTAVGSVALFGANSNQNTAVGAAALFTSTGGGNIALGFQAGLNLTTGSNNIAIGHLGVAGEGLTIRLGNAQTATYIAGITGRSVDGATDAPVLVDGANKLGTIPSSRRVKQDIADMGEASRGLGGLRPVTFRYRPETGRGAALQYGLIAEEVAEVYPELVVRDAAGEAETVKYHVLPVLLLNELQRLARQLAHREAALMRLAATVAGLAAEVARLREGGGPAAARHGGGQ